MSDARGQESSALGYAAVTAAVVAGIGLRFATSSHLWLDEAQTVEIARLPVSEIPGALGRDGLPPLFYVLLHGWMAAFGEGDVAVRALSGVLSVAALPFAYLAGRRLAGPRTGRTTLVLLALNPFAIRYATEARMYSLIVLLVVVGVLLVDRARADPRWPELVGLTAVVVGLLYSHYWTFWLLGAVGTCLAVEAWRHHDRRRAAGRIFAATAVGCVLFVPWMPTFLDQAAHTATPWARASRPTQVLAMTIVDFGGGPLAEGLLLGTVVLLGLFAAGLLGAPHGRFGLSLDLRTVPPGQGLAAVTALTLLYGAVAGVVGDSAFATRYASVALVPFLLVAALGVARFESREVRGSVLVVAALLGLGTAVDEGTVDRTQAGELADAIRSGDPDGGSAGVRPVVVYCPDQLGPAMHRLLGAGDYDEVIFPNLESTQVDSPGRVDWYDYVDRQRSIPVDDVAESIVERAGDGNGIWIVWSSEYRSPRTRCDRLIDAVGARRNGSVVVAPDPGYFEHAGLAYFPPSDR